MIARLAVSALLACTALAAHAEAADALLPAAHFAPPEDARAPGEPTSGTLQLGAAASRHFAVHANSFGMDAGALMLGVLPPLQIDLVEDKGRVVPVQRGPIAGTHPHWEWIVQPGAAWRGTDGRTWISLPVALAERNANCVHNGLLKVALTPHGAAADFQIAAETCAYFRFDMRAEPVASFTPRAIAQAAEVLEADRRERAARLPERPITDLSFAAALGSADQVPEGALTVRGAVLGGTHYVSDCPSRAGPYPFCSDLVLPSYSWAKSIFAGIAAMRLERLYPGAMRQTVAAHVAQCGEGGWGDVTIADALNMATGHYNAAGHEADEGSEAMNRFFLAESHAEKIAIACTGFARRADPGERFVYRTADSYIAGTAMTGVLRAARGDPGADIQTGLLQPVWDRLALSALMASPRRTYDDSAMPLTGWGLFLTRADLARVAAFLQRGGTIDGEPVLDPAMLAEALQQASPPSGLPAATLDQRYRHGFWAWNAAAHLGCSADLWVPVMSGYGGLAAALLPGARLYYHVSDGGTHRWAPSARAIHDHAPLCEVSR